MQGLAWFGNGSEVDSPVLLPGGAAAGPRRVATGPTSADANRNDAPSSNDLAHRYKALFDDSLDAIFALDNEGRFTEINPAAERLSGYSAAELVTRPFSELCVPDQVQMASRFFDQALHGDARTLEIAIVRRDGRHLRLFISGTPIVRDRVITGIFCIARDITRRRKLESELRTARRDAEQATRIKDRFLSVVSHELRTPLAPVLATVQVLQDRHDLSPDMRDAMGMIRRNLELEARLIDDLLDLSRIRHGRLELMRDHTDVHSRIRNVLRLCESDVRARELVVELHLHATHHRLFADPGRIQQVIWNLLKNAIKYTPNGGRVMIQTRNVSGTSAFPTSLFPWIQEDGADDWGGKPAMPPGQDQRFVVVEVVDTGVGIGAEEMPRLFDTFDRLDEDSPLFGGLGIGLTISRALVELHGGRIWAHSDGRGHGATFTVALPLREIDEPRKALSRCSAAPPAVKGRRILLVEDHADTAKVMAYLLRSYGYSVTTAATVAAAIAACKGNEFDLLVSDIGLPDGTGMEVMNHLRERKEIPGVALSGFGMEDDIARSRQAGFAEHLVKPINLKHFEAVLHRLLG